MRPHTWITRVAAVTVPIVVLAIPFATDHTRPATAAALATIETTVPPSYSWISEGPGDPLYLPIAVHMPVQVIIGETFTITVNCDPALANEDGFIVAYSTLDPNPPANPVEAGGLEGTGIEKISDAGVMHFHVTANVAPGNYYFKIGCILEYWISDVPFTFHEYPLDQMRTLVVVEGIPPTE